MKAIRALIIINVFLFLLSLWEVTKGLVLIGIIQGVESLVVMINLWLLGDFSQQLDEAHYLLGKSQEREARLMFQWWEDHT